jgi:hypothetical protein
MITALFDSNIYGRFVEEKEAGLALANKIKQDPNILIHNFRLIRNELRKAPKMLTIYDTLVANRIIAENNRIKNLAKQYFKFYKENKGVQSQKKIMNDFKIVACATILNCDLVVTEDQRTLLNPIAVKAYRHLNLKNNLRMPTLYRYHDLKRKYS